MLGVIITISQANLDNLEIAPEWNNLLYSLAILVRLAASIAEVRCTTIKNDR